MLPKIDTLLCFMALIGGFRVAPARDWIYNADDLEHIESKIEKYLGISRKNLKKSETW